MNPSLQERVAAALADRQAENGFRLLSARPSEGACIDLSNNDYLRLARHPQVIAAAQEALEGWGASASASPLITGYTELHRELEDALAGWSGFAFGLVWNTGYAANQGVLGLLPQRGDLVLADRLIHNSMISGIQRSGARLQRYRHIDMAHLEALLASHRSHHGQVFVVTETVFSMDGDYPELDTLAELKARYGFCWIVDEAHAIGWYGHGGSGLIEASGLAQSVDVLVGTLGKGLGSMGAYTLFQDSALRDYLVNFAGEFIYSTYLAPASVGAALAALELVKAMAAERPGWQALSRQLRLRIPSAAAGDSPIIPVMMPSAEATLSAAVHLYRKGYRVAAVRPPTVPAGTSRLRISLNSALTAGDLEGLATCLQEVVS